MTGPGATTQANEALVRRYFAELFDQQHPEVCDELLAREYHEHAAAPFEDVEPGVVDGPAAARETVRWLLAQFPDLHFTVEAVVATDELVAVRVLGEGTNLGSIGPFPATGRRFSARSSHWFRVTGGRLAEHWATRDDLTAMRQLGLIPSNRS